MTDSAAIKLPSGPLILSGPQERPAPGTLAIRGDLAHIALAGRYFVPHYAVPQPRKVAAGGAIMRIKSEDSSDAVKQMDAGADFELLDIEGDWAWGAITAEGPSGWIKLSELDAPTPTTDTP